MLTCTEPGLWPDKLDGRMDESELDRLVEHAAACDYHREILDDDEEAFLVAFRTAMPPVHGQSRPAGRAEDGSTLPARRAACAENPPFSPRATGSGLKLYELYQRWERGRCPLEILQVRWGARSVAIIDLTGGGGAWHLHVERGAAELQFWTFCRLHGDQVLLATHPLREPRQVGEISELSFANGQKLRVCLSLGDGGGSFNVAMSGTPPASLAGHALARRGWVKGSFLPAGAVSWLADYPPPAGVNENSGETQTRFSGMRLADLGSPVSTREQWTPAAPPQVERREPPALQAGRANDDALSRLEHLFDRKPARLCWHVSLYHCRAERDRDLSLLHHPTGWGAHKSAYRLSSWLARLARKSPRAISPAVTKVVIHRDGLGVRLAPTGCPRLKVINCYTEVTPNAEEMEADIARVWRDRSISHQASVLTVAIYELISPPWSQYESCRPDSNGARTVYDPPHGVCQGLLEGVSAVLFLSGFVLFEELFGGNLSGGPLGYCRPTTARSWRERLGAVLARPFEALAPEYSYPSAQQCADAVQLESARYMIEQLMVKVLGSQSGGEASPLEDYQHQSGTIFGPDLLSYHSHDHIESPRSHHVH